MSELPLCCTAQEVCMWPSLSSSAVWVRMLCTLQRTLANADANRNVVGCELCPLMTPISSPYMVLVGEADIFPWKGMSMGIWIV